LPDLSKRRSEDSGIPGRGGGAERGALTWIDSQANADRDYRSHVPGTSPHFRVGDVGFRCGFDESSGRVFSIVKDPTGIETYLEMVERFQGENFVELGISFGGSVALTALVAPPRKLAAVDLKTDRVEALDELIAERGLGERVRLHYGVDQADRDRLAAILDEEFGDEPLGLVIDDASHHLDETRASFETLFPRLRPGGLFVIEDWNHDHLLGRIVAAALADPSPEALAQFDAAEAPNPPLTRLVIELILAQAESDEFVREMELDRMWARIYRGSGELDASEFRVADLITSDFGLLSALSKQSLWTRSTSELMRRRQGSPEGDENGPSR
jgi:predicted O-methyltransferase YrrM